MDVDRLTAWHACDRCGQRSKAVWFHDDSWLILTLCYHHSEKQRRFLSDRHWVLIMSSFVGESSRFAT